MLRKPGHTLKFFKLGIIENLAPYHCLAKFFKLRRNRSRLRRRERGGSVGSDSHTLFFYKLHRRRLLRTRNLLTTLTRAWWRRLTLSGLRRRPALCALLDFID